MNRPKGATPNFIMGTSYDSCMCTNQNMDDQEKKPISRKAYINDSWFRQVISSDNFEVAGSNTWMWTQTPRA